MDISEPDTVDVLSEMSLLGNHFGLAVDVSAAGNVVYVANEERLVVLDVSDRNSPQIVDELVLPATAVHVHNSFLFVAGAGLMSFDIRDPHQPKLVSLLEEYSFGTDFQGHPSRMIVRGDCLFVSDDHSRVLEFQFNDTGALSFVRAHGRDPGSYRVGFVMHGDLIVFTNITGSHVYELDAEGVSQYRGSFGGDLHNDIGLYEGYAYTVTNDRGLVVYDIESQCSSCRADLNSDGMLNYFDVAELMLAYVARDQSADLNNDGDINFMDVSLFLKLYNSGCLV